MAVALTEEKQLNHSESGHSWGDVALKVSVGAAVAVAIAASGGVGGVVPLVIAGAAGAVSSFGEEGIVRTAKAVGRYANEHLKHQHHAEEQASAVATASIPSSPEIRQPEVEKVAETVQEKAAYVNAAAHTHHLADLQRERSQRNIGPTVGA